MGDDEWFFIIQHLDDPAIELMGPHPTRRAMVMHGVAVIFRMNEFIFDESYARDGAAYEDYVDVARSAARVTSQEADEYVARHDAALAAFLATPECEGRGVRALWMDDPLWPGGTEEARAEEIHAEAFAEFDSRRPRN